MLFVNLNAKIGPHQSAIADALYNILGNNYFFIEFGQKFNGQYGSYNGASAGIDYYKDRPYILKMHESEDNERLARELISKADVMRTGGEPIELIKQRLINKKLTFRSTERTFRGPLWRDVLRIRSLKNYISYANSNYRILCQSGYMANDMQILGNLYKEKCYKFAYFTQIPQLDIEQTIGKRRTDKIQIVWCARFIDLKHPELPLKLAQLLLKSGRTNFEIQMIGADTTPLWHRIKKQVEDKKLGSHVILTGGLPNTEVLERMRQSHIFVFTSSKREGWGAVLNEAMGSGCACVVSHEIGAVPFLLWHRGNGLIFKSCSSMSLFENVAYLYDNPEARNTYSKEAYKTITGIWSAQNAAKNLVDLAESILSGNEISIKDGPCSKAYPINKAELLK